jgi:hypothetical protein
MCFLPWFTTVGWDENRVGRGEHRMVQPRPGHRRRFFSQSVAHRSGYDDPQEISPQEFEQVLRGGLAGKSTGVMMFTTRAMAGSEDKIAVMKKLYTQDPSSHSAVVNPQSFILAGVGKGGALISAASHRFASAIPVRPAPVEVTSCRKGLGILSYFYVGSNT